MALWLRLLKICNSHLQILYKFFQPCFEDLGFQDSPKKRGKVRCVTSMLCLLNGDDDVVFLGSYFQCVVALVFVCLFQKLKPILWDFPFMLCKISCISNLAPYEWMKFHLSKTKNCHKDFEPIFIEIGQASKIYEWFTIDAQVTASLCLLLVDTLYLSF